MQSFYEAKQWISLTGLLALILFSQGCKPPVQELTESEPDPLNEQMVKANQYMQQRHQDHISAFVERVGWNAELSPS